MDTTQQPVKATKVCKYCKSEIPKDAKICPHCRKRVAMGMFGKIVAGFFAFIVLMIVISSASGGHSTPTTAQSEQQAQELAAWQQTPAGILCAKHPTFSKDDCDLIVAKKVAVGMSYDALVYMWGKPDSTNPSNYGGKTQYQYCWTGNSPSCFYDNNEDGIIDSFN